MAEWLASLGGIRGSGFGRVSVIECVNIYHVRVYPMFSIRACSLFLFVLIKLRN